MNDHLATEGVSDGSLNRLMRRYRITFLVQATIMLALTVYALLPLWRYRAQRPEFAAALHRTAAVLGLHFIGLIIGVTQALAAMGRITRVGSELGELARLQAEKDLHAEQPGPGSASMAARNDAAALAKSLAR